MELRVSRLSRSREGEGNTRLDCHERSGFACQGEKPSNQVSLSAAIGRGRCSATCLLSRATGMPSEGWFCTTFHGSRTYAPNRNSSPRPIDRRFIIGAILIKIPLFFVDKTRRRRSSTCGIASSPSLRRPRLACVVLFIYGVIDLLIERVAGGFGQYHLHTKLHTKPGPG